MDDVDTNPDNIRIRKLMGKRRPIKNKALQAEVLKSK